MTLNIGLFLRILDPQPKKSLYHCLIGSLSWRDFTFFLSLPTISAEISDITTKNLLEHFIGANAKDNEIAKKMAKLDWLNFGIKDLKIDSKFEGDKLSLE